MVMVVLEAVGVIEPMVSFIDLVKYLEK